MGYSPGAASLAARNSLSHCAKGSARQALDTPPFADMLPPPGGLQSVFGSGCPGVSREHCRTEIEHETPIPTVEDPAQAPARLPEPQVHQGRPAGSAQPPPGGPQAPHPGISDPMPPGSPLPLRLPRASRLRFGCDFLRLKSSGRRLVSGCLILNWAAGGEGKARRLGVVTSRKVGSAVARSRARRLLREAYRRLQHHCPAPLDLVLVARPSITGRSLAEVERDFQAGLRRAGLCDQNEFCPTTHQG